MRTLCICVLRNGLSMTKPAVASILAQTEPCDILLIDNSSSDGTAQWLQAFPYKEVGRVFSISCIEQIPLAKAWNIGLGTAFRPGGWDTAWIVNNDVLFRPDTLKWLNADPRPFVTCVSVDNEAALNAPVENPSERSRNHPDFSSFRMTKEVWETVGGFDERFIGGYCEDGDYHIRCHQSGIECVCIDVPFLHYGSGTILNADPVERRRVQQNAQANRARFKDKWGCEMGSPEYYALFK